MKKLILTLLVGFSFITIMRAQNLPATDTTNLKIEYLILVPIPGITLSNGETTLNRVEIDMKIQNPELASKAYITLKNKTTGEIIKQIEVDFIEEIGKIKYVQDNRKRDIRRNNAVIFGDVGETNPENITAEAYLINKSGQQTSKVIF